MRGGGVLAPPRAWVGRKAKSSGPGDRPGPEGGRPLGRSPALLLAPAMELGGHVLTLDLRKDKKGPGGGVYHILPGSRSDCVKK